MKAGAMWFTQILSQLRDELPISRRAMKEYVMSEDQKTVDDLTAQVLKSKTEVLDKIAALEAAQAAGEPLDFTELKAAVQGVDDIVPDAPAEPTPPVVEPEAPVADA